MANIFHVSEVVGLGIEKEIKRRDFYAEVARQFPQPELRELFEKLRDWEETHIKKFTEIKDSLNEEEAAESYSGELTAYMQALVDDKLYKDVSLQEFKKNIRMPIDAIRYGISFEKDAILFFVELKKYSSGPHQEAIEKLINEEKQHIVYLSELRKKIS